MIEVVTGIMVREGRIFLQQRAKDDKHAPLRWETPGGKVEGNESHHQALARELKEELGIEPAGMPQRAWWCGEVGLDGNRQKDVFLLAYLVPEWGMFDPRPLEKQAGFGWFAPTQLMGLRGQLNYGNELMLPKLHAELSRLYDE